MRFSWLTARICIFPQLIFFKYTIILLKFLPKTCKIRYILRLSFRLLDRFAFGKLSPAIGSKKLPWTLRNCSALHENQQIFRFIIAKICGKPRIFQGGSLLPLRFFSMEFLNFGHESRHPTLKFKPCIYSKQLLRA